MNFDRVHKVAWRVHRGSETRLGDGVRWGKGAVKGSLARKVKCGGVRGREQLLTRDQEGHPGHQ